MNAETSSKTLALPSAESSVGGEVAGRTLPVNKTIKLDDLGPMVVNSDGTLSRISNWKSLTKEEQERTLRVLGARNKLRMENEEKKQHQSQSADETAQSATANGELTNP